MAGHVDLPEARTGDARGLKPLSANKGHRLQAFPDIAKIVAVCGVVTIHTVAPASESIGILTDPAWTASVGLEAVTRWSVPLFVMVSGMLLLRDSTAEMSPLAFYRRRASRIAIPLLFWTLFYRCFLEYTGPKTDFRGHVEAIYAGQPYYHLYFLFVIAGLYVICPFLMRALRGFDERQLGWISVGLLVAGFLWTGVPPWLPGTGSNAVSLFAPYVGYFVAGPWLARVRLTANQFVLCCLVFLLTSAVSTLITYEWTHHEGLKFGRYLYSYTAPTVIVSTICVFLALRHAIDRWQSIRPIRHMGTLHFLGEATFGVFLIHPFFLTLWLRHPPGAPSQGTTLLWWWPATVIGLVILSFACTVVIGRIPFLRRAV